VTHFVFSMYSGCYLEPMVRAGSLASRYALAYHA
jgi:hypothetical protein